jgi:hypothetical protein
MRISGHEGRIWKRRNHGPKHQAAALLRREELPPAGRVGDLAELAKTFTAREHDEDRRTEGT